MKRSSRIIERKSIFETEDVVFDFGNENKYVLSPKLEEAIMVSSYSLYAQLQRNIINENQKNYILKKLEKYRLRALFRSTPFGLFSSVSLRNLGQKMDNISSENSEYQKYISFDWVWIGEVLDRVNSYDKFIFQTRFSINPSIIEGIDSYIVFKSDVKSEVKKTNILLEVINAFEHVYSLSGFDISRILSGYIDNASEKEIVSYIRELVESDILVSGLISANNSERTLKNIALQLNECNIQEELELIHHILDITEEYKRVPIGKGIDLLNRLYITMNEFSNSGKFVNIQLAHHNKEIFNENILNPIDDFLKYLSYVCNKYFVDSFGGYIEKFTEKYGFNRYVGLKGEVDRTTVDFQEQIKLQIENSKLVREKFLNYCISQDISEDIDLENIFFDHNNDSDLPNLDIDLLFQYIEKEDKYFFPYGNSVSEFGSYASRFSGIDLYKAEIAEILKEKNYSSSTFSIEQSVSQERNTNIIKDNLHTDYVLPINCFLDDEKRFLKISDIFIKFSSEEKKFKFYNAENKSEINLIPSTRLNPLEMDPIARYLYTLNQMTVNKVRQFFKAIDLIDVIEYQKRVVYKKIIILPERWRIEPNKYQNLDEAVKKMKIPKRIILNDFDMYLPIDLDIKTEKKILEEYMNKKKSIVLTEAYMSNKKSNDHKEYIVSYTNDKDYENKNDQNFNNEIDINAIKELNLEKYVDQSFDCYIIYPNTIHFEDVIRHVIEAFIGYCYYVKYNDHFVLRVKKEINRDSVEELLSEFKFEDFIEKYSVEAYFPERIKYGGSVFSDSWSDFFIKECTFIRSALEDEESLYVYVISVWTMLKEVFSRPEYCYDFLEKYSGGNLNKEIFRKTRRYLMKIFSGGFGNLSNRTVKLLEIRNDTFKEIITEIECRESTNEITNNIESILRNIFHMSANRIFPCGKEYEENSKRILCEALKDYGNYLKYKDI